MPYVEVYYDSAGARNRVRPLVADWSSDLDPTWNVQFPRRLRHHGACYWVPILVNAGKHYRILGKPLLVAWPSSSSGPVVEARVACFYCQSLGPLFMTDGHPWGPMHPRVRYWACEHHAWLGRGREGEGLGAAPFSLTWQAVEVPGNPGEPQGRRATNHAQLAPDLDDSARVVRRRGGRSS